MDPSWIQDTIENCDFFKGLNTVELEGIIKLSQVQTYEAGEKILNHRELSDELYIIAAGYVFLEKSVGLDARKGNVTLSLLGKQRALGCWPTLLREVYPLMSSAICKEHTMVVFIGRAALREMMLSDFHLGLKVMEKLCSMFRDTLQGAYGAMEKI